MKFKDILFKQETQDGESILYASYILLKNREAYWAVKGKEWTIDLKNKAFEAIKDLLVKEQKYVQKSD